MEELLADSDFWKEEGFSLVWDKTLLAQLLQQQAPFSLREVFSWRKNGQLPNNLTGRAVLVEGLQTCLEVLGTEEDGNMFLTNGVRPFIRYWQRQWPHRALIFGLHCDFQWWTVNVDNYASLQLQHNLTLQVTQSLWAGAAKDAKKLMVSTTAPVERASRTTSIPGGFYVRRYS